MKVFTSLLLTFYLFTSCLFAQVQYEKRIEVDLRDSFYQEVVREFGDKGFIVRSVRKKRNEGEERWRFRKYNTSLEEMEIAELQVAKSYFLDESTSTDDRHFLLYQNKKDEFLLYNLEIESMELAKVEGAFPKKSRVRDIKILGDYAYFKAYIRNEPVLFTINWQTGKTRIIPIIVPGYNRKKTRLQNVEVLTESNEVFAYVKVLNSRKENDMYIIRFDDKGEKQSIWNFTSEIENNIVDISSFKINDEQYVFTGTYSTKSTVESEGLFFSQATNDKVDYIRFYNFLDLNDFLSYLPDRKENRIARKRDRKQARGQDFKIDYRIAGHGLITLDDGYLFIGEAYYPTYRSESVTTYRTVNGISTPVNTWQAVFDGYQYTHAIIAKFSKTGEVIWDRIFDLWKTNKPFYVARFLELSEVTDRDVKLVYSSGFKIASKHIDYNGEILQDLVSEEIETGFDGDKTKWSSSYLSYWYDNYFIAYGQQKIKNKENDSAKSVRKVFYFNKLSY